MIIIGELTRIKNLILRMYPEKGERHNLPHVHVQDGDYECVININDGSIIEGELSRGKYKLVKEFIETNRGVLLNAWSDLSNGITFKRRF